MMAKLTFDVEVKIAWWVWPYLYGVYFLAEFLDLQPDEAKVQRTIKRGIRTVLSRQWMVVAA